MVKRGNSNPSKNGVVVNTSSPAVAAEKRVDYWDTNTERAKQEIAYYQQLDAKINSQISKELNAMLMMIRSKQGKLCQLDRQYLRSKITLLNAKLEASELCEQQILKINVAIAPAAPLPR